jgi:rRNA-processing protein FCF1
MGSINLKKELVIVLDANFIFLPAQFKIDYLNEIEENMGTSSKFIVYQQILDELEAKKQRIKDSRKFEMNLDLGLRYLEQNLSRYQIEFKNEVKRDKETTDEFLLRKCVELKKSQKNVYLATNDGELRKKAKKEGINVIFLRQESYLSIERT